MVRMHQASAPWPSSATVSARAGAEGQDGVVDRNQQERDRPSRSSERRKSGDISGVQNPRPSIQSMDEASVADLLAHNASALRRYAARLSASSADADDLMQDTCLKCWRARHRFAAGSNFVAWARTVMRHTFLTSVRRRRHDVDVADDIVEHLQASAPAQHMALELKEALSALDHLHGGHRRAVIMASEGVSVEDGAAALDIPVNTYKSWVRRGRTRLGQLIDGADQPLRVGSGGSRFETRRSGAGPIAGRSAVHPIPPTKRNWSGVVIG